MRRGRPWVTVSHKDTRNAAKHEKKRIVASVPPQASFAFASDRSLKVCYDRSLANAKLASRGISKPEDDAANLGFGGATDMYTALRTSRPKRIFFGSGRTDFRCWVAIPQTRNGKMSMPRT